jgi:hypothetical protein
MNHDISIGKTGPAERESARYALGRRENVLFASRPQAANSAAPRLFSRPNGWLGHNGGKIGAALTLLAIRYLPITYSDNSARRRLQAAPR